MITLQPLVTLHDGTELYVTEVTCGGQFINLLPGGTVVDSLWTLIDEEDIKSTRMLQHLCNVFVEDRIHDWNQRGSSLYYYSRVIPHGQKQKVVVSLKKSSDNPVSHEGSSESCTQRYVQPPEKS